MHVRDSERDRRPHNSGLVLLALVVLLAVVALASSGHVAFGNTAARRPGYELADTVFSLLVVFVLLGGLGIFVFYYVQRTNSHEERRKGGRVTGGRALRFLVTLALLLGAVAVGAIHNRGHHAGLKAAGTLPTGLRGGKDQGYTPHFAPIPVAVALGLGAAAAFAAYLSYRARRRALGAPAFGPSLELTLADVLRETLDDLRAEPDPRVAVIAAYARLERTLAAFGMPRREADAPLEYLERILVGLDVGGGHASRLTQLFEQAKFSTRAVGPEMKDEAIELLEAIRADLHTADAAREQARARALAVGQAA